MHYTQVSKLERKLLIQNLKYFHKVPFFSNHFICSMPVLPVRVFLLRIIEHSLLIAIVFYHRDISEKVSMQKT